MARIEHALKSAGSLKAVKRKLGIGKNQIYALRDKKGNVDKIVKVAEAFYRDLYSSRDNQDDNGRRISPEELDIPPVRPQEVKKTLDTMQSVKAADGHQVTADMLKHGGQIALGKLATLYTQCLMTSSVPESCKNANIVLLHKKGDVRELKNYRRISLLSVAYKVFRKVIANKIRSTLDFHQPNDQAGFLKGYPTIDHIQTIISG